MHEYELKRDEYINAPADHKAFDVYEDGQPLIKVVVAPDGYWTVLWSMQSGRPVDLSWEQWDEINSLMNREAA